LKNPFVALENGFSILLKLLIHIIYSAKKYEKLYLFMGRTNKNTTIPTNSIYYRAFVTIKKATLCTFYWFSVWIIRAKWYIEHK